MLRFLAKRFAKLQYRWNQEAEAGTNELHAGLALRLATEKCALIEKLNKEADDIDANIKSVDEKLTTGYWECENGHEYDGAAPKSEGEIKVCFECVKQGVQQEGPNDPKRLMKFVARATMTGQEKYESDKERGEAEKIAASKREQAKAEEENLANSEKTAKYFKGLAENNRRVAEKIRSL